MKKYIWVVVLLVCSLWLVACSSNVATKKKSLVEADIPVKVMAVANQDFAITTKINAKTESNEDIMISAMSSGIVEWLGYEVGDRVKRGDMLVHIDSRMSKAQYEAAKTSLNTAENFYFRQKKLYKKRMISDQVLESAKLQYDTAKAQKKMAGINYENSFLAAPIKGLVAQKFVDEKETVMMGMPIYNVINSDKIKVVVKVSENEIIYIKKLSEVQVLIPSLRKNYKGYIESIGFKADENKKFPVTILIENKGSKIKPGMMAEAKIFLEKFKQVVVLRLDYIIAKGDKNCVMVVSDGKAIEKEVILGKNNDGYVHIEKGLINGELLIVEGQNEVLDGQGVKIVK